MNGMLAKRIALASERLWRRHKNATNSIPTKMTRQWTAASMEGWTGVLCFGVEEGTSGLLRGRDGRTRVGAAGVGAGAAGAMATRPKGLASTRAGASLGFGGDAGGEFGT